MLRISSRGRERGSRKVGVGGGGGGKGWGCHSFSGNCPASQHRRSTPRAFL